jgi:protein TonB
MRLSTRWNTTDGAGIASYTKRILIPVLGNCTGLHAVNRHLNNSQPNSNNMKKISMSAASLWMMGALTSIVFMVSCKGKDYKDTDATTDSLQAKMAADSIARAEALKTDSLATANAPVVSTLPGTAKPNPAKKRGKGSIVYQIDKDYEARYNRIPIQINNDGIYSRAEVRPSYPGGEKALTKFIQENIIYPEGAIDEGVEGRVDVMFAVDENGRVYTPVVTGDRAGYGLDEEATRVVSKMPTWNPGQIKGKNVKSYYTLPITFRID